MLTMSQDVVDKVRVRLAHVQGCFTVNALVVGRILAAIISNVPNPLGTFTYRLTHCPLEFNHIERVY